MKIFNGFSSKRDGVLVCIYILTQIIATEFYIDGKRNRYLEWCRSHRQEWDFDGHGSCCHRDFPKLVFRFEHRQHMHASRLSMWSFLQRSETGQLNMQLGTKTPSCRFALCLQHQFYAASDAVYLPDLSWATSSTNSTSGRGYMAIWEGLINRMRVCLWIS